MDRDLPIIAVAACALQTETAIVIEDDHRHKPSRTPSSALPDGIGMHFGPQRLGGTSILTS